VNTLVPGFFLRTPVPDYDSPVIPRQTGELPVAGGIETWVTPADA
jgi:hypothetical protein